MNYHVKIKLVLKKKKKKASFDIFQGSFPNNTLQLESMFEFEYYFKLL